MEHGLLQVLLLLGVGVASVVLFQRLQIPTSLAYLMVGLLLGPFTFGPVVDGEPLRVLAEFGIVFLLFTIGLNFSLPRLLALRHQVLGLGTAQVALCTGAVMLLAWGALGLPLAAAFVVGAVFAQSSTTIISKQLAEQGEEDSRHGRLGTAMSVFQDVTAVPFVVVIPVLGTAASALELGGTLGLALLKALLALLLVFFAGRRLLSPLFHVVTRGRSAEVFTLTVLLVSLAAGWVTNSLGLSMAFGAFLAGMVLGETEFRHQVESAIRPFRDVLLGLFFVGIGMLFDPAILPDVWLWALLGTLALLASKLLIVAAIVRAAGIDAVTAWRTGLVLAVGGEFGFALLAIALGNGALDERTGQVVLTSVLFSMVIAPFLIRHSEAIARRLALRAPPPDHADVARPGPDMAGTFADHVLISGYGRVGQSVAHFLEGEGIPFVALDLDAHRVREAHRAGEQVYYGDATEAAVLEAVGLLRARLMVISNDDIGGALKTIQQVRALRPDLPIMVRTRDETHVDALREAGATEVVPETLEAGLMIASHALLMLDVPLARVFRTMQAQRAEKYRLLRGYFRGDAVPEDGGLGEEARLRPITVFAGAPGAGHTLEELGLLAGDVSAVVRAGERTVSPPTDFRLLPGDIVVLFGSTTELDSAERKVAG
ncbi:cation:proton antiporter [Coralloluteibacterium thermophilus]|uniref:Cation:proton antiporter n=1 Tax=Coralloluteibacterium thermophilum TaxID=2707049 RepID=A0ABV9NGU0_9GAMM